MLFIACHTRRSRPQARLSRAAAAPMSERAPLTGSVNAAGGGSLFAPKPRLAPEAVAAWTGAGES